MQTPWGPSQTSTTLGAGVVQVTTAGHGGIHLDSRRNAEVHTGWCRKDGWYEEDCDWAIVALSFPDLFPADHVVMAHTTAKDAMPDEYEQVLRVKLLPAESFARREQLFRAATCDKLVVTAAWGSRATYGSRIAVPDGMVGVVARIGGLGKPGAEERWFLVPDAEYARRDRFGFVVDEHRHAEWPNAVRPGDSLPG